MANKKSQPLIEHKLYKARFPDPHEGVNLHWCYQNNTSLHDHDYYEFIIITEGKVQHFLKSETSLGVKGSLFLVKPGVLHQFLPYHNSRAKQINFSISPPMLESLMSLIWSKEIFKKFNEWELPNDLILPQSTLDDVFNNFDRLNQFNFQSTNSYASIKAIILEILLFLVNKLETTESLINRPSAPAWLNEFLETLNSPSVFTMKLKDIYPLAPYSQSMLNLYFNKYVGCTLISYITNLKISYACSLLRYTDDSPLDISNKLAYDSLSHFNRVFKKITGKSPIVYRKEIANVN